MTFKYTFKDEYRLDEILYDLFSENQDIQLIESFSRNQVIAEKVLNQVARKKVILELMCGASVYDVPSEANNFFTELVENCEEKTDDYQLLDRMISKKKSQMLSQSRFRREDLTFAYSYNSDPIMLAEILLWAEKNDYVWDFIATANQRHVYDSRIIQCDSYEAVQKTVKFLQEANADILKENLETEQNDSYDLFEKEKLKSEIQSIRSQTVYPFPVIRFERVSSVRQDKEVYDLSDVLSESMCLFTMPSKDVTSITDNGIYFYKLGNREIFEFVMAEDFRTSLKSLQDFSRYANSND